jgi:dTDP-4-dehydrorhamnose 3,5-epimerase
MIQADQLSTAAGVPLQGPLLLTPRVFGDARGFFYESWNQQVFAAALAEHGQVAEPFVQDNHSRSRQGVLRGLHWQLPPHPQGKLVRCVVGTILDVAVDLRRSSATFGQWAGARLSADNHQQLWIPAGFAHGFVTLSDQAEVLYKTTDVWNRESERALRWDDPAVAVDWPLAQPILSDKDGVAPLLAELPAEALFA